MTHSSLWKFSISCSGEAEDAVSNLLNDLFGQPAVAYHDAEKSSLVLTVYLQKKPRWNQSTQQQLRKKLKGLKNFGLDAGPAHFSLTRLRSRDWAESWKYHFRPLEFGPELLIKPGWSTRRPRKGQALVVLDPGLSFGTGQHATTSFCLRQLVRHRHPLERQSFLDIGTGSGILAIAAAKLGYSPIRAFDFDPQAVRIARTNARFNRVPASVKIHEGDVEKLARTSQEKYQVICANLISNLLLSAKQCILACLHPRGVLVVAGILRQEFSTVQKSYESSGLRLYSSQSKKEWRSGAFVWSQSRGPLRRISKAKN